MNNYTLILAMILMIIINVFTFTDLFSSEADPTERGFNEGYEFAKNNHQTGRSYIYTGLLKSVLFRTMSCVGITGISIALGADGDGIMLVYLLMPLFQVYLTLYDIPIYLNEYHKKRIDFVEKRAREYINELNREPTFERNFWRGMNRYYLDLKRR